MCSLKLSAYECIELFYATFLFIKYQDFPSGRIYMNFKKMATHHAWSFTILDSIWEFEGFDHIIL